MASNLGRVCMFVIHRKNQPLDISRLAAMSTFISKIIQSYPFYVYFTFYFIIIIIIIIIIFDNLWGFHEIFRDKANILSMIDIIQLLKAIII